MNHQKISSIENAFRLGQRTELTFEKFSLKVPNEPTPLEIIACRPKEKYNSYYYLAEHPKEKIVIHHTAGHLQGDLRSLTRKDYHVSVPFVIARDGTIYQLHHSKYWSYHLGKGTLGGNGTQSKKGIGIELSNYGYLKPKGQHLETYHSRIKKQDGSFTRIDKYCERAETGLYVKLDKPYRKYNYYASFTEAQYTSLIRLLRYLTKQYNIPVDFLPDSIRYQTTQKVVNFKGITSHVNFRKDKFDIGPAFDWEKVIAGTKAATFSATDSAKIERAESAYLAAEKAFQIIQVKIWDTNSELPADLAALKSAEQKLVATHLELQRLKTQSLSNNDDSNSTSPIVSEDIIDKQIPSINSRSVQEFGEDGPDEMPFDYDMI